MGIGYGMQPPAAPERHEGPLDARTPQARWFERLSRLWRAAGRCVQCGRARKGRKLHCARCLAAYRRRYTPVGVDKRYHTPPPQSGG